MKIALIQFSPTGGTARAAEALCSGLGEVAETVDLTSPDFEPITISADTVEAAVIAMPSFGGLAPALAAERMGKVTAEGMPCVILAVYGNRAYDNTLVHMSDLAKNSGFEVAAAVAAVAEHSIVREFAAGRPDSTDIAALTSFGEQIAQKLEAGSTELAAKLPGDPDYKAPEGGGGPYPKATGKCTKCGICAAKCPTGALDAADPKTPDTKACASCMRCISVCPNGARKVGTILAFAVKNAIGSACKVRKECELLL